MTDEFEDLVIRHHDEPVSLRDALHRSLDSLLDVLIDHRKPLGAVTVWVLDGPMGGVSAMLAVDLDPHECDETCDHEDEGDDDTGLLGQ